MACFSLYITGSIQNNESKNSSICVCICILAAVTFLTSGYLIAISEYLLSSCLVRRRVPV
jgi:hypothetical protein